MTSLTASDEVLIAAVNVAKGDAKREFTEWDLTVAAWKLNMNRWGLRGYEEKHPDHKRVMMELMGAGGLVKDGYLERPRANHYRVTPSGFARALAITAPRDTRQRNIHIYDALKEFAFHRAFEAHLQDPDEPRTWLGAAAFLNLPRHDARLLESQLTQLKENISAARQFMKETERTDLRRGDSDRTLSIERLDKLEGFLLVLEARFKPQFEAIRTKR